MKKSKILLIVVLLIAVMLGIVVGSQNKEPKKEETIVQSNEKNNSVDQIEIITEYINIRKSKDITSEILGKVKKGEIYTILENNETSQYKWIKIKTKNGIEGYVSGQEGYVKIIKAENKSSTGQKTELEEKNNQEKEENKKTEQNNKPTPSKPNRQLQHQNHKNQANQYPQPKNTFRHQQNTHAHLHLGNIIQLARLVHYIMQTMIIEKNVAQQITNTQEGFAD